MGINTRNSMLIGVIEAIGKGTPGCYGTPSQKLKEIKRYLDNPEEELTKLHCLVQELMAARKLKTPEARV